MGNTWVIWRICRGCKEKLRIVCSDPECIKSIWCPACSGEFGKDGYAPDTLDKTFGDRVKGLFRRKRE
jgi:hypothetical protein